MNILENICANKRKEIVRQQEAAPCYFLEKLIEEQDRQTLSFRQALLESTTGIIAEFKRKSPSKGWIHPQAEVTSVVDGYVQSGASAISCLTDELFFGGSLTDFKRGRMANDRVPMLRKDFIVDEYQLYQSKLMGADVVLLIAACLTQKEVMAFTRTTHELGMEVLLEIHSQEELDYLDAPVDVVGINNRNLKTFDTNLQHTLELGEGIPNTMLKISESGLSQVDTIRMLRREGFRGFLIGEAFMKTDSPSDTLKQLINELNNDHKSMRSERPGQYPGSHSVAH